MRIELLNPNILPYTLSVTTPYPPSQFLPHASSCLLIPPIKHTRNNIILLKHIILHTRTNLTPPNHTHNSPTHPHKNYHIPTHLNKPSYILHSKYTFTLPIRFQVRYIPCTLLNIHFLFLTKVHTPYHFQWHTSPTSTQKTTKCPCKYSQFRPHLYDIYHLLSLPTSLYSITQL